MNHKSKKSPLYSIIILLEELRGDFKRHVDTIARIFEARNVEFEILIISNGAENYLKQLKPKLEQKHQIRAIALNKKAPQAVCLNLGLKSSRGEIIAVFGSYQQITEASFDKLLDAFDESIDIVSPWRKKRVDPGINQIQSQFFNLIVRKITGTSLHDLSCTAKIFRREVLEETVLYGNMYRFLPILAERNGFKNKEVDCEHYKEYGRVGFFGISVYLTRLIDILTLYFNTRFTRKPLRFFSFVGCLFFLLGISLFGYVFLQKILIDVEIGGRAVLLIAILSIVLGSQIATTGLLGEIVAFTFGRYKKEYMIDKII